MAAPKNTTRKDADKPEPEERTVTVQGLKITISTSAMKSLDVVEALNDVNAGHNEFAIIDVFKNVFGVEQYQKIKDHLGKKHDVVDLEHMSDFFRDALKKAAPNS